MQIARVRFMTLRLVQLLFSLVVVVLLGLLSFVVVGLAAIVFLDLTAVRASSFVFGVVLVGVRVWVCSACLLKRRVNFAAFGCLDRTMAFVGVTC